MKTYKSIVLAFTALCFTISASSQSADEIISKYIDAIGGKDLLMKITSVYTEGTLDAMGTMGTIKSTLLNGKGMKQEIDVMGNIITTCYTDKGGWSINPMTGSYTAETMPEKQYNSGKDGIYPGGQFLNYAEKGYMAELLGTETISGINAFKIKITLPDSTSSVYYFDPNSYYLLRSDHQSEMQGQIIDNIFWFSDYKQVEGYALPHKIDIDFASGQFTMTMTINKVELNKPVDEAVFAKPQ